MSSEEILRGLEDFTIDVGITYLDNEPISGLLASPLYSERYCLFVAESNALANRPSITWKEAAEQPLCLLTANMQNRRIIDRAFLSANCHPMPQLETNSVINLCANVRLMGLSSIMPEYILDHRGACGAGRRQDRHGPAGNPPPKSHPRRRTSFARPVRHQV